jgi:Prealbumin-like fold domain
MKSSLVGRGRGRTVGGLVACVALIACVTVAVTAFAGAAASAQGPGSAAPLPACSTLDALGIPRQLNMRASAAMIACGRAAPGEAKPTSPSHGKALTPGVNVDVITGGETYPHVTQSEDQIFTHGSTVAVAYNDSRDAASGQYSGISVSTDGGATFTRLLPSPFATGHGNNYGDPVLVYNAKLGKWFAGDLAGGCGGQGIGLWSSTDAMTWSTGVCAHSGGSDDRESMAVDNNPASPYYGRMYISWNDFDIGSGALYVMHSDDGTTWSPVQVQSTFIRDVQTQVAENGTVLVATMDEGGGGSNPRQNFVYRSTDGGATFGAAISMGAAFAAPGDSTSGYFAVVDPIWRYMGWGDLATGANNVVVYSYTVHGTGAFGSGDGGDIYVVRSTDNGLTWSAPLRVDGDAGSGEQWMPSTAGGGTSFLVAWYDRRNTTDGTNYERWGVTSTDGGQTWSSPQTISDVLITQPQQPDPSVQADYAGDYMRDYFDGTTFYDAWTDGRNVITVPQQDVELTTLSGLATGTITVTKHLISNPIDPAKFNLRIDGTTHAANVGNGGTTGAVTVSTGDHTVSETAGVNANLGNYTARIACSDGSAAYSTSLPVHVDPGQNITCTITNTRKLFRTG